MNSKTLLFLAASYYQLDAIRCAKKIGYRIVTADNQPQNPGHRLADRSYTIDTRDRKGILEIAQKERVDGVLAVATDVAVPTAAFTAEKMDLPGPSLLSAETVCDKLKFRSFLKEIGFLTPNHMMISMDNLPERSLFESQKWIIKPDQSSGSKGIFIIDTFGEFESRLCETLEFSPTGNGVLEKYIDGFQGTVEGIIQDGAMLFSIFLDRQVFLPPYTATCGHHLPTRLSPFMQDKVKGQISEAWRLLNVTNCVFDCDFILSDGDVYLLEMSPRIGGNSIAKLLKKAADIDMVEYAIKQACGDAVCLSAGETVRPTAVVLLGVSEKGKLYFDSEQARLLKNEVWVDQLCLDFEQGHTVLPFKNGQLRVGEALIRAANRDQLDDRVIELKKRLALKAM